VGILVHVSEREAMHGLGAPLPEFLGVLESKGTRSQRDWPTANPFCICKLNSHIFSLIVKEIQRERERKRERGKIPN
jgi:hypothetical protein